MNSDYSSYGRITSFVTPAGQAIDGPGLANATILADPVISQKITLLDQGGSVVSLRTVQVLPIADSLLYVRPLYVVFADLVPVVGRRCRCIRQASG